VNPIDTGGHETGGELIVDDRGRIRRRGGSDRIVMLSAAIKGVGPSSPVTRQMLSADAVMSAGEPGFDVAE
jgi:hypothetical protein